MYWLGTFTVWGMVHLRPSVTIATSTEQGFYRQVTSNGTHTSAFTLYCYKAHFTAGETQTLCVHDFTGLSVAGYLFKVSFMWVQSPIPPGA